MGSRLIILSFLLLFSSWRVQKPPAPVRVEGNELSQDWQTALADLQRAATEGWIGYSILSHFPDRIWIGNFRVWIIGRKGAPMGGESLEDVLHDAPPDLAGATRLALLFRISPEGQIRGIRFQDLRLRHQGDREPLIWLGHREVESSLDHLLSLFESSSGTDLNHFLITAVGLHESSRVLPKLRDWLRPEQPSRLREAAAGALAYQPAPEAVELARSVALSDSERRVREEAVEALEEHPDESAETALIALLAAPAPGDVHVEAAEALGSRPTERAASTLESLARDTSAPSRLRAEAIESLGEQRRDDSLERLQRIFHDTTEKRLRLETLESIAELPSEAAARFLEDLITSSDDPVIQQEALEQLVDRLEERAAIRLLGELAERHRDPRIRAEALEQLADHLASETVATVARSALQDPHHQVRREAIEILAEVADEAAIDALVAIARDPSVPSLRRAALEALAESGHPRARQALLEMARGNR